MVSRWWLASASFPVLAGVFSAMTVMFSICTVSHGWQEIHYLDGSTSATITQQAWAVALKAVSLAFTIVAHVSFLLTTMSKRNSVHGFVTAVICWCVSGVILITIISIVAQKHVAVTPAQRLQYTQNFFYGTFAAGLCILSAMLLAVYTISTCFAHPRLEQRQIVERTSITTRITIFDTFLIAGAAVYASIEGWSFMDALYWADYTILTVGIGDIAPKTHLGRSLLFPYASAGIMAGGLVISSITSFTDSVRKLQIQLKIEEMRADAGEYRNMDKCCESSCSDKEKQVLQVPPVLKYPNESEILRVERAKHKLYKRNQWAILAFSGVAWFFLWLLSAVVFRRSEKSQDWSYFESLYFTYTSLTTIGYGDLYPTSNFGKAFFVFWSLLAVPVLTTLVNTMAQLGVRKLTYFLRYVFVPHRTNLWCFKHESYKNCFKKRQKDSVPTAPCPGSQGLADGHGICVGGPSKVGERSEKVESMYRDNNPTLGESSFRSKSLVQAAQRSILIGDECSKLISILLSGSTQLDLHNEWINILPLLHPETDGEYNLLRSDEGGGSANEFVGAGGLSTDPNKEIMWMIQLLTEKLCENLREGLHRDKMGLSIQ